MYHPTDQLSIQLLESIPRKVAMWLFNLTVNLGEDHVFTTSRNAGAAGTSTLLIDLRNKYLSFSDAGVELEIQWDDGFLNPRTNLEYMAEAANYISKFVTVEQAIYEQMKEFQEKLEEERERDSKARGESV